MVLAWRVTYLMRKRRTSPDLDAWLFFDPDGIRGANLLTKKEMPTVLPTLNEVVRLIAQAGGFFGRKSGGESGATTIWRGLSSPRGSRDITRTARRARLIYV
jgi:hypothetical protein